MHYGPNYYSANNTGSSVGGGIKIYDYIVAAADSKVGYLSGADLICTGVHDEEAINTFIAGLANGSNGSWSNNGFPRTIYFCPGSYMIGGPVYIPGDFILCGAGENTGFFEETNMTSDYVMFYIGGLNYQSSYSSKPCYICFKDISFYGVEGSSYATAIRFLTSTRVEAINVGFYSIKEGIVSASNTFDRPLTVDKCQFYGTGSFAIDLFNHKGVDISNCNFVGAPCTFTSCTSVAISGSQADQFCGERTNGDGSIFYYAFNFNQCNGASVSDIIFDLTSRCVYFEGCLYSGVSDIKNTGYDLDIASQGIDFKVANSSSVSVSNINMNNAYTVLDLNNVSGSSFNNITMSGAVENAFALLVGCTKNVFSNCTITLSADKPSFREDATCDYEIFSSNIITNSSAATNNLTIVGANSITANNVLKGTTV